ncbi:Facilitated trehalose transporter Tret1 [Eumeta japonica]|uniref:Facilitated trehalose transporter Tret1 n=1 Tax=Eumeta variegata TaxID=151549 RepID=A0A4C1V0I5_EUMVA|nr:Facilitated trehalose transporter Tret1 [Eumeta japonica]
MTNITQETTIIIMRTSEGRNSYRRQILAALAVSLGPFAAGLSKGYMSPAIASLQETQNNSTQFSVSDQEASWIASLSLLGLSENDHSYRQVFLYRIDTSNSMELTLSMIPVGINRTAEVPEILCYHYAAIEQCVLYFKPNENAYTSRLEDHTAPVSYAITAPVMTLVNFSFKPLMQKPCSRLRPSFNKIAFMRQRAPFAST